MAALEKDILARVSVLESEGTASRARGDGARAVQGCGSKQENMSEEHDTQGDEGEVTIVWLDTLLLIRP